MSVNALDLRSADAGPASGGLIVNADDWGRTPEITDRIAECVRPGAVSSVSAMVFMEDSERAAPIALERGIEAGLHLNFTTPFSAPACPPRLVGHQRALRRYLERHRYAQIVFHPGLAASFEYVVAAQLDEFHRRYGRVADRVDGHHHMHLCANVLLQRLLPLGALVRRSFSFEAGEKSLGNRLYRKVVNDLLARRHRLVDFFFSLRPFEPAARLERIAELARRSIVELETHPIEPDEHRFLTSGALPARIQGVRILSPSAVPSPARWRHGRSID